MNNSGSVSHNDAISNKEHQDDNKPFFVMTLEFEKGKQEYIKIFPNTDPDEVSFNFCKENNLNFVSMKYLKEEINELLCKFNEKKMIGGIIGSNNSIEEVEEENYLTMKTCEQKQSEIINEEGVITVSEENNDNDKEKKRFVYSSLDSKDEEQRDDDDGDVKEEQVDEKGDNDNKSKDSNCDEGNECSNTQINLILNTDSKNEQSNYNFKYHTNTTDDNVTDMNYNCSNIYNISELQLQQHCQHSNIMNTSRSGDISNHINNTYEQERHISFLLNEKIREQNGIVNDNNDNNDDVHNESSCKQELLIGTPKSYVSNNSNHSHKQNIIVDNLLNVSNNNNSDNSNYQERSVQQRIIEEMKYDESNNNNEQIVDKEEIQCDVVSKTLMNDNKEDSKYLMNVINIQNEDRDEHEQCCYPQLKSHNVEKNENIEQLFTSLPEISGLDDEVKNKKEIIEKELVKECTKEMMRTHENKEVNEDKREIQEEKETKSMRTYENKEVNEGVNDKQEDNKTEDELDVNEDNVQSILNTCEHRNSLIKVNNSDIQVGNDNKLLFEIPHKAVYSSEYNEIVEINENKEEHDNHKENDNNDENCDENNEANNDEENNEENDNENEEESDEENEEKEENEENNEENEGNNDEENEENNDEDNEQNVNNDEESGEDNEDNEENDDNIEIDDSDNNVNNNLTIVDECMDNDNGSNDNNNENNFKSTKLSVQIQPIPSSINNNNSNHINNINNDNNNTHINSQQLPLINQSHHSQSKHSSLNITPLIPPSVKTVNNYNNKSNNSNNPSLISLINKDNSLPPSSHQSFTNPNNPNIPNINQNLNNPLPSPITSAQFQPPYLSSLPKHSINISLSKQRPNNKQKLFHYELTTENDIYTNNNNSHKHLFPSKSYQFMNIITTPNPNTGRNTNNKYITQRITKHNLPRSKSANIFEKLYVQAEITRQLPHNHCSCMYRASNTREMYNKSSCRKQLLNVVSNTNANYIVTHINTNPNNNKSEMNYGEYLYIKGEIAKEKKRDKMVKYKQQQMQALRKICKFKPQINQYNGINNIIKLNDIINNVKKNRCNKTTQVEGNKRKHTNALITSKPNNHNNHYMNTTSSFKSKCCDNNPQHNIKTSLPSSQCNHINNEPNLTTFNKQLNNKSLNKSTKTQSSHITPITFKISNNNNNNHTSLSRKYPTSQRNNIFSMLFDLIDINKNNYITYNDIITSQLPSYITSLLTPLFHSSTSTLTKSSFITKFIPIYNTLPLSNKTSLTQYLTTPNTKRPVKSLYKASSNIESYSFNNINITPLMKCYITDTAQTQRILSSVSHNK